MGVVSHRCDGLGGVRDGGGDWKACRTWQGGFCCMSGDAAALAEYDVKIPMTTDDAAHLVCCFG